MSKNTKKVSISWLEIFNFIILQWFCIRLARIYENDGKGNAIQTGWRILKFPVPLTGWWNNYKWIKNNRDFQSGQNKVWWF